MEPGPKKEAAMRRLMEAGVSGPFDIVVCAALGYAAWCQLVPKQHNCRSSSTQLSHSLSPCHQVQIQVFHALLGILDLVTNKDGHANHW